MKKSIIKATAMAVLTAVVVTCFPIDSVKAAPVVSAGGALAAGNGYSLHDIRAKKARNAAKKSAVSNHAKITEPKAGKTIQLQDTNDKISVVSDAGDVLAELQDDSYTMKIPQLLDETVIEKVETPASKAVNEGVTVNGVAVVGSASEAAKIEITSSEDSGENDNGTDEADNNGENDTEATEDDVKDGNADASNPVIDIKPDTEVEEGAEDLSDRVIAECDGYVRVRATPDEEGEIVGKLYNHSAGTWLGKEGDWYKIESGNVVGYVKGEYVKTGHAAVQLAAEVGQRMAKVTTTTLKIRSDADAEAAVLGLVGIEDELSVLEERDEWVKVNIEEGDGWVSKEYVALSTYFPPAESKEEEEARLREEEAARRKANASAAKVVKQSGGKQSGGSYSVSGSGLGSAVANYGLQFVGNPYVYGGTSLTNGTDCSGFTMGVYSKFGVSLPHSSGAQRSCGYGVGSLAEAIPGDIICYSGHVAIYIGNGQIVHASTAATGIKVSNVSYRSILAIRRIF